MQYVNIRKGFNGFEGIYTSYIVTNFPNGGQ